MREDQQDPTGPDHEPGPGSPPDLVSLAEAARMAGVTERAIRKALDRGAVQGIKNGSGWAIDAATVATYAAGRTTGPDRADHRTGPDAVPPDQGGRVRVGGEDQSGETTPDHGAGAWVSREAHQALLERHEAAVLRIGQLMAEREHLALTAGAAEDRVREAEDRAAKAEAALAEAAARPRRRWWWPWGQVEATP